MTSLKVIRLQEQERNRLTNNKYTNFNKKIKSNNKYEEIISENFICLFNDWNNKYNRMMDNNIDYIDSDSFEIGYYKFILRIYPHGLIDKYIKYCTNEFVTIKLINISNFSIDIKYIITLIHQNPNKNIKYEDPEGIIRFDGIDSNNNEWGSEEFILFNDFINYINNNTIKFNIYIELFNIQLDIDSLPWAKEIKTVSNNESDLIQLANKDLASVIRKLPLGNQINEERQQDHIISSRLHLHIHMNGISSSDNLKSIPMKYSANNNKTISNSNTRYTTKIIESLNVQNKNIDI